MAERGFTSPCARRVFPPSVVLEEVLSLDLAASHLLFVGFGFRAILIFHYRCHHMQAISLIRDKS